MPCDLIMQAPYRRWPCKAAVRGPDADAVSVGVTIVCRAALQSSPSQFCWVMPCLQRFGAPVARALPLLLFCSHSSSAPSPLPLPVYLHTQILQHLLHACHSCPAMPPSSLCSL